MVERASWGLEEGAEIVPGRLALKAIGGGSRYEAFLAWDERLFALVVAKLIRPDQVDDEHALRELAEEADALAGLAHPMIVRGFDAVLGGSRPHLALEHLEGPSLRRLLRGGPLSAQQLLPVALHIAGALAYLANSEMAHLDVKPDNIIVGVPPRLIDLSIARSLERAARSRGPLGTDAYMAPEQCGVEDDPRIIGSPADVWGLGATLYHCAAGERPFPRPEGARDSDDLEVRFPQLVTLPKPLPDYLPGGFADLVAEMLDQDPAARPGAAEVADRLEPLVAGLPRKLTFGRGGLRGA